MGLTWKADPLRNLPGSVATAELWLKGHDLTVEFVLAAGAVPHRVAHAAGVDAQRARVAGELGRRARRGDDRTAAHLVGEVAAVVYAVAILHENTIGEKGNTIQEH